MKMHCVKIEVPRLGVGDGSSSYLFGFSGLCFKARRLVVRRKYYFVHEICELFYVYDANIILRNYM